MYEMMNEGNNDQRYLTEFDDVIRISTNYLDYMNLLDIFNKYLIYGMNEGIELSRK